MTAGYGNPGKRQSWADAATASVFAVLALIIIFTFQDYGISWDEELHVPYGHKLLAFYTSGFADRSAFSFINLYQYGGFFDLVSALAALISPFGEYETRHLIGGVFFLAGLFGAWRLATLLAGAGAGFLTVVCLATTPLLYGHSFINPKDAPLAWLGVWVAYYVCRILGEQSATWRSIVGLGVSLGLALGMRIIAFAFIGQIASIVGALALGLLLTQRFPEAAAKTWRAAKPFLLALPIALVVMGIVWPWSVQAPGNILSVFTDSANLYWHPDMLWAGRIINSADLPASYLIVLLAVQMSEVVLLGILLVTARMLMGARAWRAATLTEPRTLQYLYLALTVIVPLGAFALLTPSTYNGVRHFLFVVPQLVMLAALGLAWALTELARRTHAVALVFAGVLALGLIHQVVVMVRVHPYQYLAFNSLTGGLSGAAERFELDYWGVTYKEATAGLAAYVLDARAAGRIGPEKSLLFVCGANTSAGYYLPDTLDITDDLTKADFYMGADPTNPRCRVRPEGRAIVEVKRDGAVLSYVLDLKAGP